jgi:hypothetical protein
MSRSTDDADPPAEAAVDNDIAFLLAEIEREKVPDRLMKLALELQNALAEKRRGDIKN